MTATELDVRGDLSVYRGLPLHTDVAHGRWARSYVNAVRWRATELECAASGLDELRRADE